ncbi:hypothetical protein FM111_06185 [Brevundimonas diminuta 3F5N]|uniref:Uncharacterized protein n=1 Tax=Brevundimonas diminuta 3F5N TaxID=1255603 RepID=A0A1R4FPN0_BREDI|nr:hypothetical protein [Brevundimonas diminuta]SJM57886.1 hypothetical protein FM111_06185 [Brevundimonas diminuta 3F5N]
MPILLATALALTVAACERGAAPEKTAQATAFKHDLPEDVSGYYIPTTAVQVGDWRLHHLFMGQVPDFMAWRDGQRTVGFAPIMMEFEAGDKTRRTRLIPTAYDVSEDRVRFEATSRELGAVSFDGRLDQDALAKARRNLGDQGVVLKGTLKVGGRTFDGVSMRWWAGD